ncbi:hypothetical protein DICVIV_09646 [Dictyocaulus viviparus]|uniref:Uncharacterized protein n=1 Tax=Dictyocaulus viviparus TaxID=29172 RepID=A0A0D8XI53_DICVI|nr:hypothetical protein DICVIV_09646 [Dictyocaulus viviparus]
MLMFFMMEGQSSASSPPSTIPSPPTMPPNDMDDAAIEDPKPMPEGSRAGNSFPSILANMLGDALGCVGFSWVCYFFINAY